MVGERFCLVSNLFYTTTFSAGITITILSFTERRWGANFPYALPGYASDLLAYPLREVSRKKIWLTINLERAGQLSIITNQVEYLICLIHILYQLNYSTHVLLGMHLYVHSMNTCAARVRVGFQMPLSTFRNFARTNLVLCCAIFDWQVSIYQTFIQVLPQYIMLWTSAVWAMI